MDDLGLLLLDALQSPKTYLAVKEVGKIKVSVGIIAYMFMDVWWIAYCMLSVPLKHYIDFFFFEEAIPIFFKSTMILSFSFPMSCHLMLMVQLTLYYLKS